MVSGVKRARGDSSNSAHSTQVRETDTKLARTMEVLLKDERHRSTRFRSQAKLLEIDRDSLREDLEALTETFNTAKTGLMFKDGQIEQLEVAIDDCKVDWQRLNVRLLQRDSDVVTAEKAKADALELCMLHEQHADDARARLKTQEKHAADEQHRSYLRIRVAEEARKLFKQRLDDTQKELERVRAESEATRGVCEELALECGLKATDECQTYATLQLACCGSFICEPCAQAWNKNLGGDGQARISENPKLLRCFSRCSHGRHRTEMSVQEIRAEAVRLHRIGCACKTR